MCICKQHVPVICTCTNIMLFFFTCKIGVKIKAIFNDSGSLQLPVCAYMPNNISSVQLFVPGFPTPRHSGFHHLQGYHSKAHKSIGEVGGGYREIWRAAFPFFFCSWWTIYQQDYRSLVCTCHLILGASWPFDLQYMIPITCHAPQTV